MAVTHGIAMDNFLSQYPQALREWIEQDLGWKAEEIANILLEDDPYDFIVHAYVDRKTDEKHEKHETAKADFCLTLDNGEWTRRIFGFRITPSSKQEMSDEDAFEIMDRIRRDMRHE